MQDLSQSRRPPVKRSGNLLTPGRIKARLQPRQTNGSRRIAIRRIARRTGRIGSMPAPKVDSTTTLAGVAIDREM
jgi:hypothetical protein